MVGRACICGAVLGPGERCTRCQRRRDEERAVGEPWRRLYSTREWQRAQRECLNRDGGQCRRLLPNGERCTETQQIQAHHTTLVRDLWKQARGDWKVFVRAATRLDVLVALCPADHAEADRILRRSRRAGVGGG